MEFVEMFNTISLGTLIAWSLALVFLGGCISKIFEKYRKLKNDDEQKTKTIKDHDDQIKTLNTDVTEIKGNVTKIIDSIEKVIDEADRREARRLRREILKFSDNLHNGKTPSKDAFQDIIESNEEYDRLIAKREISNGYTAHEMEFVIKKYDELYGG